MTYNIVEVVPGKYAIRRRTFFQELFSLEGTFLDLTGIMGRFWWSTESRHFHDCLTSNMESLVPKLELLKAELTIKVIM